MDDIGTLQTFRYASGDGYNHPTAPGYYEPRIANAANYQQQVAENLRTFGISREGAGEVTLKNAEGGLDELYNHGYGRQARLLLIEKDSAYNTAQVITDGIVEQPSTGNDQEISFRFRDKQQLLRKPLQPAKFDSSMPAGIQGKPKPRTFGKVLNISPVLIDTGKLIYAWNYDRAGDPLPTDQVIEVRDGGYPLTFGTDRADSAALEANTPAAGHFDTCLAESKIRLGSLAAFSITMDVIEGAGTDDNKVAYLAERMLLDAGIEADEIDSASVAAFHADADYTAGLYSVEEGDTYAAIDQLISSGGGFCAPDATGVFQFGQLKEPGGSPVLTLKRFSVTESASEDDANLLTLKLLVSGDDGRGVPCYRTILNYAPNYTQQDASSLAAAGGAAAQDRYGVTHLTVTEEDPALLDKFTNATQLEFTTLLTEEADAAAEAARRQGLYGARRQLLEVEAQLTAELIAVISLGATVGVKYPRYGMDNGKNFIITRLQLNARTQRAILNLWG